MSIEVMAQVFRLGADVTPTQRLVMLAMADHADDDGICWPSVERIADKVGMSARAVQKARADLLDRGLLEEVRVLPPDVLDRWEALRPDRRPKVFRLVPRRGAAGSPRDGYGVNENAERGAPGRSRGVNGGAPESSLEPSKKRATKPEVVHRFTKGTGPIPLVTPQPAGNKADALEQLRKLREERKHA